jgi:hypothetical protein
MSRRPATVTQADVARIIRAAKAAGARTVEIRLGGTAVAVVDLRRPLDTADETRTDGEVFPT